MSPVGRRRKMTLGTAYTGEPPQGPYEHLRPIYTLPRNYDGSAATFDPYTGFVTVDTVDTRYAEYLPITEVLLTDLGSRASNYASLVSAIATAAASGTGTRIRIPVVGDFGGKYLMPVNNSTGWIYIESASIKTGSLPAGTKVLPADVGSMAKIPCTSENDYHIYFAATAKRYRFTGIECTYSADTTVRGYDTDPGTLCRSYGFFYHAGSATVTNDVDRIIIDRCYLHGSTDKKCMRAVYVDGTNIAVIDSYIDEIISFEEGQGMATNSCVGPYKVDNNTWRCWMYGENIMFGGGSPYFVPANIQITRNHFWQPQTWRALYARFGHKNLFEMKMGTECLIQGNVFNGFYNPDGVSSQVSAMNLKTVDQYGTAPDTTVRNVTVRLNEFRDCCAAVGLAGRPSGTGTVSRWFDIHGNRHLEPPDTAHDTTGVRTAFRVGGTDDTEANKLIGVRMQWNTMFCGPGEGLSVTADVTSTLTDWVFSDNVLVRNTTAFPKWIKKDNSANNAATDWATMATGTNALCTGNAVTCSEPTPPGNNVTASIVAADLTATYFALNSGSPFKSTAAGSRDPGCVHALIDTAISGVAT